MFDVAQQTTLGRFSTKQQRATGATRTAGNDRYGERRTRNPSISKSPKPIRRSTQPDHAATSVAIRCPDDHLQAFQSLLTQRLVHRHSTRRCWPLMFQRFATSRVAFGTHEDNRRIKVFRFQKRAPALRFTHTPDSPVALADVRRQSRWT